MRRTILLIIIGCAITIKAETNFEDSRCRCVCPSTKYFASNQSSEEANHRRYYTKTDISPGKCTPSVVVHPQVTEIVDGTHIDAFLANCDCRYESRNTVMLKVVVIFVMCVIAVLLAYMAFLLCLDPMIRKQRFTVPYRQHNDELEENIFARASSSNETPDTAPTQMRARNPNVLERVEAEQNRWMRKVEEQRKSVFDDHSEIGGVADGCARISGMISSRKLASELTEAEVDTLTTDELQQACIALLQHAKVLERDVDGFRNDAQRLRQERNVLREKVDELTDSLEVSDADRKRLVDELDAAKLQMSEFKKSEANRVCASPLPKQIDTHIQRSTIPAEHSTNNRKRQQTDGLERVSSPSSTSSNKINGRQKYRKSLMPQWDDLEMGSSSPVPPPPPPPPLPLLPPLNVPPPIPGSDQWIAPPPPPPALNFQDNNGAGPRTPPQSEKPPWMMAPPLNSYQPSSLTGPSPSAPYTMVPPQFSGIQPTGGGMSIPPPSLQFGMRQNPNNMQRRSFNESPQLGNSAQRSQSRFNQSGKFQMEPKDRARAPGIPLLCGKIVGPTTLTRNDSMMVADRLRGLTTNLDQNLLWKNTHYHKCYCKPCGAKNLDSPAEVIAHALSQGHIDKIYSINTGISSEDFDYWMKVLEKSQAIESFNSSLGNNSHAATASLDC
ncbi:unnamed protein product, partial [Mesorhabditis belari]|uniref:Uncharacterized protein n=1 Tax=Mesorhabditis belari TaxID=2138241 RepID=A0AAF3J6D2_9BILA